MLTHLLYELAAVQRLVRGLFIPEAVEETHD
jgi:hypothetical protein